MCTDTRKPDENIIFASVHYVHLGGDKKISILKRHMVFFR